MARQPKASDFQLSVDGIGSFTFARRNMAIEVDIQREYARILDGVPPTAWLEIVGNWIATFKVLTVRAPDGWDVDEMDSLDNDSFDKMKRVYNALSDKELSFRSGLGAAGQGSGQATG